MFENCSLSVARLAAVGRLQSLKLLKFKPDKRLLCAKELPLGYTRVEWPKAAGRKRSAEEVYDYLKSKAADFHK